MTVETSRLWAVFAITFPCAAITLFLRLISRRLVRDGYGYDDALAVLGFGAAIGYQTVNLIWLIHYGLGRPKEQNPYGLSTSELEQMEWFYLFLVSETYTFVIAFCKFSILAFYWRIFKYSDIRIPIQVLSVMTVLWFFLRLFVVNLQCIPIQAMWTGSIEDATCGIKKPAFFFSTGLTHLLVEVILIILPAFAVAKLRLPKSQKIPVIMLFMFGILTCVASIFGAVTAVEFNATTDELGLDIASHLTWSLAEVNLSVISTSLPLLRPVLRKFIPSSCFASQMEGSTTHTTNLNSGEQDSHASTRTTAKTMNGQTRYQSSSM